MKLLPLVLLLLLSGCVKAVYTQTASSESLEVISLFKSVDGLGASRDSDGFQIIIDKTYTHDPLRGMRELLETYNELYDLGIRIEPNED